MSHFLFIRNEPFIPKTLREVFSAPDWRIVTLSTPQKAESALSCGAFDSVILYKDRGSRDLMRKIGEVRERAPDVFTIVLAADYDPEEEKAALDAGADLYFSEPIPTKSLSRVLNNCSAKTALDRGSPSSGAKVENINPVRKESAGSTLKVLRDLSHILSYSLDYKAFTQHFILKLRDHISFSRMGIFLESSAKQNLVKGDQSKNLTCIASLGLPSDLTDCFQLSRGIGIGRELWEEPRILRRQDQSTTSFQSPKSPIEKEFAILGCHLAIPITDRENAIGLAVLSGPVTGRDYTEDELELLFLLMEELGMAIRNSRLHSELRQHGQLIENVMHSMASGAIVFSEDLDILYINDAARRFLNLEKSSGDRRVEFAELPAQLAGPVHLAVEKGELPESFKMTSQSQGRIYQISIFPFTQEGELLLLPRPTMVIIEDFTKIEASKATALADSKSELIRLIAERFAHEIRNSLVPLSTHAQLMDKKIGQPKFQKSLKASLLKETARIKRFSEQMLYLAQSTQIESSEIQLVDLIRESFDNARSNTGNEAAELNLENKAEHPVFQANYEAILYAFEELFINSLQAVAGAQEIRLEISQNQEGILRVHWRDGGPGFSPEAIEQGTEPFFTTRNTGVGLGLSVAHKVIAEHNGYLRLNARSEEHDWDLEIELPSLLVHV